MFVWTVVLKVGYSKVKFMFFTEYDAAAFSKTLLEGYKRANTSEDDNISVSIEVEYTPYSTDSKEDEDD